MMMGENFDFGCVIVWMLVMVVFMSVCKEDVDRELRV